MKDFFISYNQNDKGWAEWIAWTLEEAKYTVAIQAWDILPGSNFVLEMNNAVSTTKTTIAVLSVNYLASIFTQPEWASAFASDPTGTNHKLLPVRVESCEPPGLLKPIVYCDLVGLDREHAKTTLLTAASGLRAKPVTAPAFPGGEQAAKTTAVISIPDDAYSGAAELLDILKTTYTTFQAQARLRDTLYDKMNKRLQIKKLYQYEDFFDRFFDKMNDEEKRIHKIIRSYTANVLREYNEKALLITQKFPTLNQHIPLLDKLKQHLIIWLNKYKGVFEPTPSMCLLYVGVEENVPFPTGIETQIGEYLKNKAAE